MTWLLQARQISVNHDTARSVLLDAGVLLRVAAALYFIPSYALSLLAQRLEVGPEARTPRQPEPSMNTAAEPLGTPLA